MPSPADASGGYSGTPLAKKLGVKPGAVFAIINRPEDWPDPLPGLPDDVEIRADLRKRSHDVVVIFSTAPSDLETRANNAVRRLAARGGLWLAWPKKASGVDTDLSDGAVRAIGLGLGLVDNKTCSITSVWSGLRFVRRVQ